MDGRVMQESGREGEDRMGEWDDGIVGTVVRTAERRSITRNGQTSSAEKADRTTL